MNKLRPLLFSCTLLLTLLFSCGCETDIVTGDSVSEEDSIPTLPDPPVSPTGFGQEAELALELVNELRAKGCNCGTVHMPPVAELRLNARLMAAAEAHSADMATHQKMRHEGSDGSNVGDRVTRAGFTWRAVAENVAWNQPNVTAVVTAWKNSPGHCRNLMGEQYTDMGFAEDNRYWAQVFAR